MNNKQEGLSTILKAIWITAQYKDGKPLIMPDKDVEYNIKLIYKLLKVEDADNGVIDAE